MLHLVKDHFGADRSTDGAISEVKGNSNGGFQSRAPVEPCNVNIQSLAITPVDTSALKKYLEFYDRPEAEFLLDGFLNGFPIQYTGPRAPRDSNSLRSTALNPEIIKSQIHKQIVAGRVAGPFKDRPMPNLISPL